MTQDNPIAVEIESGCAARCCLRASGHIGRGADTEIKRSLDQSGHTNGSTGEVILNMADVTFIDSAGISSLLDLNQELARHGGRMMPYAVPPLINRTFEVVGMARLIPILDELPAVKEGVTA